MVPKELFPGQQYQTNETPLFPAISLTSSVRRPVKLPLRKHHSFHFQPSQTVAGAMKQTKNRYKNHGPLVFKPFNEKSAFKPITPVPKSPNKTISGEKHVGNIIIATTSSSSAGSSMNNLQTVTAPRICGTSLKRHISNVETYNANRIDETNSMTDDEDSTSTTPPSSSSASTARGKRLHYADLAPLCTTTSKLSTTSNTNLNLINNTSNCNNNINNNSSSCNISCDNKTNLNERIKTDNLSSTSSSSSTLSSTTATMQSLPIKRTTQYATLKFNEVNI